MGVSTFRNLQKTQRWHVAARLGVLFALLVFGLCANANSVTNVTFSQQGGGANLVDVYYDLTGSGSSQVILSVSSDGGLTYKVPVKTVTGHVGTVAVGTGKHLVWNAGVDWPAEASGNLKVRVTAWDLTGASGGAFATIPSGTYQMGNYVAANSAGDGDITGAGTVSVTLSRYYMQVNDTTKTQWDAVYTYATSNGYTFANTGAGKAGNHPVQMVSWYDVVKWTNAASEMDGLTPCYRVGGDVYKTGDNDNVVCDWSANGYRLPTEAEWEIAARGGLTGKRFPWGDTILQSQANYQSGNFAYDSSGPTVAYHASYTGGGTPYTSPVQSFLANGYGLYDMAGNVEQWCWDWYAAPYRGGIDPVGGGGTARVMRGGAWIGHAGLCRSALRDNNAPNNPVEFIGFRLARGFNAELPTGVASVAGVVSTKNPGITIQPNEVAVLPGMGATLNATAVGTGTITYQWRKQLAVPQVTAFAGTGNSGSADNAVGTSATFDSVNGAASDAIGNLYLADSNNNRIRKITPAGAVSTFAGDGNPASADHGSNPLLASFNHPIAIALDLAGNIYVSDQAGNVIRKITTGGAVVTIAGDGTGNSTDANGTTAQIHTPSGIAVDKFGNVYVAEQAENKIRKIAPNLDVTTVVTGLNQPSDVKVAPDGSLIVSNVGDGSIKRVTLDGGVTTLRSGFSTNERVDVDVNGFIYVSEGTGSRVVKVSPDGGTQWNYLGAGSNAVVNGVSGGNVNYPRGLVFAQDGNVYVVESGNNKISKVATTQALPGGATSSYTIGSVTNGTVGEYDLVVGNGTSFDISKTANVAMLTDGAIVSTFGNNGAVTNYIGSANADLKKVTQQPDGKIVALGKAYNGTDDDVVVVRYNPGGALDTTFNGNGKLLLNISGNDLPGDVVVRPDGKILVMGTGADGWIRLIQLTSTGVLDTSFGASGIATVDCVTGDSEVGECMTLQPDGGVLIGGHTLGTNHPKFIARVSAAGSLDAGFGSGGVVTSLEGSDHNAVKILTEPDGRILFVGNSYDGDYWSISVRRYNADGSLDLSYAASGVATLSAAGGATAYDAALQADGKLVVVGSSGTFYLIHRLTVTGTDDATFGSSGRVQAAIDMMYSSQEATGVIIQRDGKITITGTYVNGGVNSIFASRYQVNGFLDNSFDNDGYSSISVGADAIGKASTVLNDGRILVAGQALVGGTQAATLVSYSAGVVAPYITHQTNSATLAVGGSFNMNVEAVGSGSLSYQWRKSALVSTVVGNPGVPGSTNAVFTNALADSPEGIVRDSSGNFYFCETNLHVIRKIAPDGTVSLYAGSLNSPGTTNGALASALFNYPKGLTIDGSDNLYVADSGNGSVRKISGGTVSTLAGTYNNPSGVAVNIGGTNVYVSDTGNHTVWKISGGTSAMYAGDGLTSGTLDGSGSSARFNSPRGITVDASENVYVADTANHTIRKITFTGGMVSTIAGVPTIFGSNDGQATDAHFYSPYGLTVDSNGVVYVADKGNATIRKIFTQGGVLTTATVVGVPGKTGTLDGFGSNVRLSEPFAVALGTAGTLYIADPTAHTIRKVTLDSAISGATASAYSLPIANKLASGVYECFVSSAFGNTTSAPVVVNVIDPVITGITGGGNFASGATPSLGVTVSGSGGFTYQWHRGETQVTTVITGLPNVSGVAVGKDGALYGTSDDRRIMRISGGTSSVFAGNGGQGHDDGTAGAASFNNPGHISTDAFGNFYIGGDKTVRRMTPSAMVTTLAGNPIEPAGTTDSMIGTLARFGVSAGELAVAADGLGNLYVADTENHTIRRIGPDGAVVTLAGQVGVSGNWDGAGSAAQFNNPKGITVDRYGNIYVADTGNHRIRKMTPDGNVSILAGSSSGYLDGNGSSAMFNTPLDVVTDAYGNVYVTDSVNKRIRKITPSGSVTTVAGSGATGADNGSALGASFGQPDGICIDDTGALYVADTSNNSIRKITFGAPIPSATGISYSLPPLSPFLVGDYRVVVTGANGVVSSNAVNVGMNLTLSAASTDPSASYQWMFNGGSIAVGGTASSYVTTLNKPRGVLGYSVAVTTAVGAGTIRVNEAPLIVHETTPYTPTVTVGGSVSFGVTAIGSGSLTYSWVKLGSDTVGTLAGSGTAGMNNATGAAAQFDSLGAVASDKAGNIYVADAGNNRIRKIAPNGTVTTFAGEGTPAYLDGAALIARFNSPKGVAVDSEGNVYVADTGNHRIRKISAYDGSVSTLAGSGTPGGNNGGPDVAQFNQPSGVAVDLDGNVFVADTDNFKVRRVSPYGVVSTWAGNGVSGYIDHENPDLAQFGAFSGISVDRLGNVYVADREHNRIRHIAVNGRAVSTFAGDGTPGSTNGPAINSSFNFPDGVFVDNSGGVYVTEKAGYRIRSIYDGQVFTVAGNGANAFVNGAAGTASFQAPAGITISPVDGSIIVADFDGNRIRKVDRGTLVSGQNQATFSLPSVTVGDAGEYLVVVGNQRGVVESSVYTLTVNVPPLITVQPPTNINVTEGNPFSLDVTAVGTGSLTYTWYKVGLGGPLVSGPMSQYSSVGGASSEDAGNYYCVVYDSITALSTTSNSVAVAVNVPPSITSPPIASGTLTGGTLLTLNVTTSGTGLSYQWRKAAIVSTPVTGVNAIGGMAMDSVGNIYVSSLFTHSIYKFPVGVSSGTPLTSGGFGYTEGAPAAAQFSNPQGMAVDSSGNVYIADSGNNRIRKISVADGNVSTLAGTGVPGSLAGAYGTAQFSSPYGLAISGTNLIVVQSSPSPGDHIVRQVSLVDGFVTNIAGGNGEFGAAKGVAVDAGGNIYLSDVDLNKIVKVWAGDRHITTLAGDGTMAFGDGAPGSASFNNPRGLAVDSGGNVYVADSANNLIRRIAASPSFVTTYAGDNSFSGTLDGPSTVAEFNGPEALVVDASGNIYVADYYSNTIRKITPPIDLVSQISSTLSISGVKASDEGAYDVVVSNAYGSVVGTPSIITVNAPPEITSQPASAGVLVGGTIELRVSAKGKGTLLYDWKKNGVSTGGALAYFVLSNVVTTDTYCCVVTDSSNSLSSASATVTVTPKTPPSITSVTGPVSVNEATSVSLSVVSSGATAYQWRRSAIVSTISGFVGIDGVDEVGDVVCDSVGNIYFSGWNQNNIRKIDAGTGLVSVYAGSGAKSYLNGPALTAQFSGPGPMAIDSVGNIYVADQDNYRIRMVASGGGSVTTVAGSGVLGYLDGPGATAQFATINGLAVDSSGNIFVSDANRIRKIAADTKVVSTLSGNGQSGFFDGTGGTVGTAMFNSPAGLAVDPSGILFVSDSGNARIRKVALGTGDTTTLAGNGNSGLFDGTGGPSGTAMFSRPMGIVLDGLGNLYVCDQNSRAIRKVIIATGAVTTISGNGSIGSADGVGVTATYSEPAALTRDSLTGNLVMMDDGNLVLRRIVLGTDISSATGLTYTNPSVLPSDAGYYEIVVSNADAQTISTPVSFSVNPGVAPSITSPIVGGSINAGQSLTLSVVASGTPTLTYQWLQGRSPISGANSQSYTVTTGGSYSVTVANGNGSITSNEAVVTVNQPPAVVVQPASAPMISGGSVTYTANASGTGPFTYQWRLGTTPIPGATGATFTITSSHLADVGLYTCVITGPGGSVTTEPFESPLRITTQPQAQLFALGGPLNLSVGAVGAGSLTYQWYKDTAPLPGETKATYSKAIAVTEDKGSYSVVVGYNGLQLSSQVVSVSQGTPEIVMTPEDRVVVLNGGSVTLSVSVLNEPLLTQKA
ncbi:MAG: immunoglobulin domain-containing protein, partial [Verrucomicrobiota bacterium]